MGEKSKKKDLKKKFLLMKGNNKLLFKVANEDKHLTMKFEDDGSIDLHEKNESKNKYEPLLRDKAKNIEKRAKEFKPKIETDIDKLKNRNLNIVIMDSDALNKSIRGVIRSERRGKKMVFNGEKLEKIFESTAVEDFFEIFPINEIESALKEGITALVIDEKGETVGVVEKRKGVFYFAENKTIDDFIKHTYGKKFWEKYR